MFKICRDSFSLYTNTDQSPLSALQCLLNIIKKCSNAFRIRALTGPSVLNQMKTKSPSLSGLDYVNFCACVSELPQCRKRTSGHQIRASAQEPCARHVLDVGANAL